MVALLWLGKGGFQQTLPVVTRGNKEEIVGTSTQGLHCDIVLRPSISLKTYMWALIIIRVLSLHNGYLMLVKERIALWITPSHSLST